MGQAKDKPLRGASEVAMLGGVWHMCEVHEVASKLTIGHGNEVPPFF